MSEDKFILSLQEIFSTTTASVIAGVGADDCAVLTLPGGSTLAVSTDTFVEGTHFSATDSPADIGWKAVAASLSDLAASGCTAGWGLLTVALRKGVGEEWAADLARAIQHCAKEFSLTIVGGDTTATAGATVLTVTVFGMPLPTGVLLRSGAKPGDILAVTGTLGGSILGKHLHPIPRLREIRQICELGKVNACMDISDGLALDLTRLMRASKTCALIDAAQIPLSAAAKTLSKTTNRSALEHALGDGEDFELLLALPPDTWDILQSTWADTDCSTPLTKIGHVEAGSGNTNRLRQVDGSIVPLSPEGYQHEF